MQVAPLPLQMSRVQTLPSLVQEVPFVLKAFEGQDTLVPVHVSARSHSPLEARHSVPEARNPSEGQASAVPSHLSSTSQAPTEARQTAPALPAGC